MENWSEFNFKSGAQTYRCPECDEEIGRASVNIKEGFALCMACSNLARLSELNFNDRPFEDVLNNPPPGCSLETQAQTLVARASLRSMVGFLPLAGFALFWNGIVSIFVMLAVAGLYANLIGPLPAGLPVIGDLKDGKPIMNDAPMGLGATLGLCLFLVPFVVIGFGTAGGALLNLIGKYQAVISDDESYIGLGVGFIQWKRRFDPQEVTSVRYGKAAIKSEGNNTRQIEMQADRTIKFGGLLREDRRDWLMAVLRKTLVNKSN